MYATQSLIIGFLLIFTIPVHSVYADETGFEQTISGVFDWINELFTANIQDANFDNSTTTNLQDTLDKGTEAGVKGTSLWFSIHDFFVSAIFTGVSESDFPIDKDIIVIISMIMVGLMMFALVRKLIHENIKIAIIVIIVVIILGVIGVTLEF